jgi:predicted nuclease with TOPRIM domain
MPAAQPSRGPSRQALLAEVQALRQRVAALEQEKRDLEVMLEMATDHADDLSETLQQERDDLETMLEMTTDHADALEADLQSQAEALARRSQFYPGDVWPLCPGGGGGTA